MKAKPVILGIKGVELSKEEISLFTIHKPLGVVLFRRNIKGEIIKNFETGEIKQIIQDKESLIKLTSSIKNILGEDCIIGIDQEGGRVRRLLAPIFKMAPPAKVFGDLAVEQNLEIAIKECRKNYQEIGQELKEVGININFAPVADLLHPDAHDIVGDRSFSANPKIVTALCKAALEGMKEAGVTGVIKHIPGHGRAISDSHHELPIINTSLKELEETDFAIFRDLARYSTMAMTSHIIYTALDKNNPATLSPTVISYIKEQMNFSGLIISDAIEMRALSRYSIEDISKNSLKAGVDIILECSGNIDSMTRVLNAVTRFCEAF